MKKKEMLIYKKTKYLEKMRVRNILDCSLLPSGTSVICKETAVTSSLADKDIVMGSHSPKSAGLLDSACMFKLDSSCLISA